MKKIIIIFIVAVALIIFFYNKNNDGFNEQNYTKEELKQISYAGGVKGFLWISTICTEEYCADTGYVPREFINGINNRFSAQISYADGIINKYNLQKVVDKHEKQNHKKNMKALDTAFQKYKFKYGENKTKLDFCKQMDENKEVLIQDRVNLFNDSISILMKDY